MSDPLDLDDIKNIEDLDAISTISETDVMLIVDISEEADNKITLSSLAKNLNKVGGTHVTVNDWSTYTTTEVPDAGEIIYFYNNSELGTDRRFHVIGDGVTTVANLDKCAYLEAGAVHYFDYVSPSVKVYSNDGTTIAMSFLCESLPKQDADTISLSGSCTLKAQGSNATIYTFSFSEATASPTINGHQVRTTLTLDETIANTYQYLELVGYITVTLS